MPETVTMHDRIDVDRALALAGVLDRTTDDVVDGAALPLGWQWLYFLERVAERELGPEGHPLVGSPTPPATGLRRMFAGGRLTVPPGAGRLRIGDEAALHRAVVAQRTTQGTSGPLHFATVRDVVSVGGREVLGDERDVVYLPAAPPPAGPESRPTREPGQVRRTIPVDPVLLFRFSALTYNAHRIHYDRDYARDVEGHPGLVVHGPLQALVMAEAATEVGGPDRGAGLRFEYRLVAPLYEQDGLHVVAGGDRARVWARVVDDAGRVTARATLTPAGPDE